jgi:hypothetical protein
MLLLLLLADLFRKLLDFPALGAVALGVMYRAPLAAVIADGRLTWVLVATWGTAPPATVAVAVGAPASGLSLPPAFFFFFFLLLPWAAASVSGLPAFLASRAGWEC